MKVTILAIGKCKEKAILSLCTEYIKRLKPFSKTEIVELVLKGKTSDKDLEGKALLEKIPTTAFAIFLDETGKQFSSREIAGIVEKQKDTGTQDLYFIIGGADGLSAEAKARANLIMSLSKMTMPHMLVRPVILEQVYRSFTLISNHPYHRD